MPAKIRILGDGGASALLSSRHLGASFPRVGDSNGDHGATWGLLEHDTDGNKTGSVCGTFVCLCCKMGMVVRLGRGCCRSRLPKRCCTCAIFSYVCFSALCRTSGLGGGGRHVFSLGRFRLLWCGFSVFISVDFTPFFAFSYRLDTDLDGGVRGGSRFSQASPPGFSYNKIVTSHRFI